MKTDKWTVVHHSGLPNAVEEVQLRTAGEEAKIRKAGGRIFANYSEASAFAEAENYPPEVTGLHPRVRGSFAKLLVGGLRVYIPREA